MKCGIRPWLVSLQGSRNHLLGILTIKKIGRILLLLLKMAKGLIKKMTDQPLQSEFLPSTMGKLHRGTIQGIGICLFQRRKRNKCWIITIFNLKVVVICFLEVLVIQLCTGRELEQLTFFWVSVLCWFCF